MTFDIKEKANTITFLSPGLWKRKHEFEDVLEAKAVSLLYCLSPFHKKPDYLIAWGQRPIARVAKLFAFLTRTPFLTSEDGFIRSINPGPEEETASLIFDDLSIFYDATKQSRLEKLILECPKDDPEIIEKGQQIRKIIRENRLSKYNNGKDIDIAEYLGIEPKSAILVVDQTRNDMSIKKGLGSAKSFDLMLETALKDNPDKSIIIKTHPDVSMGRKYGYFDEKKIRGKLSGKDNKKLYFLSDTINPWALFDCVTDVYVVTSQMGFEALNADLKVHVFGMPFYAGRRITEDFILKENLSDGAKRNKIEINLFNYILYYKYMFYKSEPNFFPNHVFKSFAFIKSFNKKIY